jgi:hypothetical protein
MVCGVAFQDVPEQPLLPLIELDRFIGLGCDPAQFHELNKAVAVCDELLGERCGKPCG